MRPRILVSSFLRKGHKLGKHFDLLSTFDYGMVSQNYVNGILKGGGLPIVSPQIREDYNDNELMEELIDTVDGIVLTGGADVDPENYQEYAYKNVKFVDPVRDKQELKLIELALSKNKPILGICRGLQLMNAYFGGTLHRDIEKDLETEWRHFAGDLPKYKKLHSVSIKENSILSNIFKEKSIGVNSFHHQAVDKLGEGLKATAFSPDGILEGFESKKHENVWAVQWHPEIMFKHHPEQLAIFTDFINRIKNKIN